MKSIFEDISAVFAGFSTTIKHAFKKPVTEAYPEFKRELPERSRARIILTKDPDGNERCVACYLCSGVCPVNCISMQAAEESTGRRYAKWFRINHGRCIYCGLCEEACPTSAIQLTPFFETCTPDILSLVLEKEDLLKDTTGKDPDFNFYKNAGVAFGSYQKGERKNEKKPVNVKTNLP